MFRGAVCRAAETLFARHGVEGVTMRQIAAEVGFSATAAYRYFANKEEILAAVRAAAFNRFSECLEKAVVQSVDERKCARSVGKAYLSFALANPDAYRMMFDVCQDSIAGYPELALALDRANQCMTGYVVPLINSNVLQGNPQSVGQMLWATSHGLVMARFAGIVRTDTELIALHERTLAVLMRGLREVHAEETLRSPRRKLDLVSPSAAKASGRKAA